MSAKSLLVSLWKVNDESDFLDALVDYIANTVSLDFKSELRKNRIMTELESLSIAETISKVKSAIRLAQQKGEFDFDIDKLELTLKVLSEKDLNGGFKLKIPFIDTDAGISGNYMTNCTQTIVLTLVPEKVRRVRISEIEDNLVQAIEIINKGIDQAIVEEPKFKLLDSSVELNFVIDKSGGIALIVKGGMKSEFTNTLKLYLKPKA